MSVRETYDRELPAVDLSAGDLDGVAVERQGVRQASWGRRYAGATPAGRSSRDARRAGTAAGDLRIGEWIFSPESGRLRRGGEARHLGPRQVDLLRYLSARAGEVVSKEEVLDAVWAGTIVEEGAVHRCISEIRKALGDDFHEPAYVLTVPKRGYLLLAEVSAEPQAPRVGLPSKRMPFGWMAVAGLAAIFGLGLGLSSRRRSSSGARP